MDVYVGEGPSVSDTDDCLGRRLDPREAGIGAPWILGQGGSRIKGAAGLPEGRPSALRPICPSFRRLDRMPAHAASPLPAIRLNPASEATSSPALRTFGAWAAYVRGLQAVEGRSRSNRRRACRPLAPVMHAQMFIDLDLTDPRSPAHAPTGVDRSSHSDGSHGGRGLRFGRWTGACACLMYV